MVGCHYYVGTVDGELAVHLGVSTKNKGLVVEARACRLVTMPEWQGAGVGFRFLNHIAEMQYQGDPAARLSGQPATTIFHTSHPQLCSALRRDPRWRQLSGELVGGSKAKSANSFARANLSAKSIAGGFPTARMSAARAKARLRAAEVAANRAAEKANGNTFPPQGEMASGYGGHFRAVQGFRYYGQRGIDAGRK
jgi:hypothetical protein